jgi:hypothetical protein
MEATAKLRQRPFVTHGSRGARIRAVMEVYSEASCALLVLMDLVYADSPGFPAGLPPEVLAAATAAWDRYLEEGGRAHLAALRQDVSRAV